MITAWRLLLFSPSSLKIIHEDNNWVDDFDAENYDGGFNDDDDDDDEDNGGFNDDDNDKIDDNYDDDDDKIDDSSDGGNEKNFPLPPDWAAPRQSLPPSPSFQVDQYHDYSDADNDYNYYEDFH